MKKHENNYDGLPPAAFNMDGPYFLPLRVGHAYLTDNGVKIILTAEHQYSDDIRSFTGFRWNGAIEGTGEWDHFGRSLIPHCSNIEHTAPLPIDVGNVYEDAAGKKVIVQEAEISTARGKVFKGLHFSRSEDSAGTVEYHESGQPTAEYADVAAPLEKWLSRVPVAEDAPTNADMVNHPPHYTDHPSGVECIQITEHMNFCRGNAVKYIWRAGEKGDEIEDLKKARWYIDREISRLENQH